MAKGKAKGKQISLAEAVKSRSKSAGSPWAQEGERQLAGFVQLHLPELLPKQGPKECHSVL